VKGEKVRVLKTIGAEPTVLTSRGVAANKLQKRQGSVRKLGSSKRGDKRDKTSRPSAVEESGVGTLFDCRGG